MLEKSQTNEHKSHWIQYIHTRIENNKNFIGFITGATGSGKSWACLRIAEMLDPTFTVDNVVFKGLELMELINTNKVKSGSVIVFEEAGVEANTRNWASITNKMLNFLMQTFRHRNFILIMNSPYLDFIDSGMRKLFHAEMATGYIDKTRGTCVLRPRLISYSSRMKKFYYKMLRVRSSLGSAPVNAWIIKKPSKKLIHDYEEKKYNFTKELNAEIYQELLNQEKKKGTVILTMRQKEVLEFIKQKMPIKEVAEKSQMAIHNVMRVIETLDKRGYAFKRHKIGNGNNYFYEYLGIAKTLESKTKTLNSEIPTDE